jgi:outer membrane protein assembly factor BamB
VRVTSWPNTGGLSGQAHENIDAARDFKRGWSVSIGQKSKNKAAVLAQPVSDGTLIYSLDGEARVSAFRLSDGTRVWSRDLNPRFKRDKWAFGGGLAVAKDKLYITTGFRQLKVLNSQDGKPLWDKTLDTAVHQAPVVTDKLVIINDVDNHVTAFDLDSQDQIWTYQAIVEPARILKSSGGVLAQNTLYAPFSSGELIAFDINNGTPLWNQVLARSSRTNALSEIRDISGYPVVYKDTVYAASHSGMFAAMDLKTGERRWGITADSVNTPWVAGDAVFLVTVQSELMAVNRESGLIYWIKALNEDKKAKTSGFMGMGKNKSAAARLQWSGPVLASNRLILTNALGEVIAFDPKSGERTARIDLGGSPIYVAPIAVDGKLFVVTDDAKLVAIQ